MCLVLFLSSRLEPIVYGFIFMFLNVYVVNSYAILIASRVQSTIILTISPRCYSADMFLLYWSIRWTGWPLLQYRSLHLNCELIRGLALCVLRLFEGPCSDMRKNGDCSGWSSFGDRQLVDGAVAKRSHLCDCNISLYTGLLILLYIYLISCYSSKMCCLDVMLWACFNFVCSENHPMDGCQRLYRWVRVLNKA